MQPFKSILVDIDATAGVHPALDLAVSVSRQCGARLRIVDVVHFPDYALRHLPTSMTEQILSLRREQLRRIATPTVDSSIDAKVLVGRPATALPRPVVGATTARVFAHPASMDSIRGEDAACSCYW